MNTKLMLGGNVFGYFTNLSQTQEILELAYEMGIRAIDTADVYSEGLSEKIIGKLTCEDRASWYIATKVGLKSHQSPSGLGRKETIYKKVEESLQRLKTDYIDLYQLHHFDPDTPIEETIEAFLSLKEKGYIREAGISNFSLNQLEDIGKNSLFKTNQILFNITQPHIGKKFLKLAKKHSMSLIGYCILARGLLNEKYLQEALPVASRATHSRSVREDLSPEFLYKLHLTSKLCVRYGYSLLEIALHWALQFDSLAWAIVGVRTTKQLQSLYKATQSIVDPLHLKKIEDLWIKNHE